jgi:hypothetical protein
VTPPAAAAAAPVLDYSQPSTSTDAIRNRRCRRLRWTWLALSLPALVIPFVPFACSASPAGTIVEAAQAVPHLDREEVSLVALAVPLALGALLTLWRARLLWRPATPAERIIAAALGLVMAASCTTVILSLVADKKPLNWYEMLCLGLPGAALILGVVAWITLRRRLAPDDRASAALLIGYFPPVLLALLIFWDDRKIGWYLAIPCAAAAAAELTTLLIGAIRSPLRPRIIRGEAAHAPAS